MSSFLSHLSDYLEPVDIATLSEDEDYLPGQLGQVLNDTPVEDAHLVILGCNEWRGAAKKPKVSDADAIRKALYSLYYWHTDVRAVDIGNIKPGASLVDSYAALKLVTEELLYAGKKILVIGGSHDNTLAQYQAFASRGQVIEATIIDALLDLRQDTPLRNENFLLEMLTGEPNYIKHYNHLAFQSYFVHPRMLETIDKLRFDCYRVGKVKGHIDEMEPSIRSSNLVSFDMNAIANAYAPAVLLSPNGLDGMEACRLMQYAGMSGAMQVAGIYGFEAARDVNSLTAIQVAHMVWYFIDGMQKQLHEAPLEDRNAFNEFTTVCAEVDTLFLQSKYTGRWWVQLPDQSFTPCAYSDYLAASHNDLPERWLRAQERM
jgi:arginase family enzyme